MGLGVERPLKLTDGLQRLDAEEVLARELETRLAHGEGWGWEGCGWEGWGWERWEWEAWGWEVAAGGVGAGSRA